MRVAVAIFFAFIIFFLSWLINASVVMGISIAATSAGVKPGLLLVLSTFLNWIVSPGVSSGIAIYSIKVKFNDLNPSLILVGFSSITFFVFSLFILSFFLRYLKDLESLTNLLVLIAQTASILIGARVGAKF